MKYTLNAFNRKVIVLVCLEKTSCYLYMLSGMFFSVAGFTHLSFIRQGYYQGYYHFSALLWNKIPAKYPCCPGCFSLWQDLFCCLLSDKDIIRILYYITRALYHIIFSVARFALSSIIRQGYYLDFISRILYALTVNS